MKAYGTRKAKFLIIPNAKKRNKITSYRLERGFIRKGTKEIVDCKTKYFKTHKGATNFGHGWLKRRSK